MQGKRGITTIWDWLGIGSMGESYEVLPTVQPVVQVDAFDWSTMVLRNYSSTTPLIAGTVSVQLPFPSNQGPFGVTDNENMIRVWINLAQNRTSLAAGSLLRLVRGVAGDQMVLHQDNTTDVTPQSVFRPVIGGRSISGTLALSYQLFGLEPQIARAPDMPLIITAAAAAAVGDVNLAGTFIDVPRTAPLTFFFPRG